MRFLALPPPTKRTIPAARFMDSSSMSYPAYPTDSPKTSTTDVVEHPKAQGKQKRTLGKTATKKSKATQSPP